MEQDQTEKDQEQEKEKEIVKMELKEIYTELDEIFNTINDVENYDEHLERISKLKKENAKYIPLINKYLVLSEEFQKFFDINRKALMKRYFGK